MASALSLRAQAGPSQPIYEIEIKDSWMAMADGTLLSVTYYIPKSTGVPGTETRFPVLLELLPYRKDDSFYARDFSLYTYFVRRGYMIAKVDVRGTGSSHGTLPEREYSDVEIADAVEIIRQLASLPNSTGRVGMFGISWGGFNSIITAMEQPPELKAILAVDASDDLFYNDVRFIDGALHFDAYELSIDHENSLPRSPDYPIDSQYFVDRFDQAPWIFKYKRNNFDSEFWRKKSVGFNSSKLKTPAFLIGGLLDGYRDSVPRMFKNAKAPIVVELGPWNHAWPDDGEPGPRHEWREKAVRWWDHWLKGIDTGLLREPRFMLFVREGHSPGEDVPRTPGHWRYETWPIARTKWWKIYPAVTGELKDKPKDAQWMKVNSRPSSGIPAGFWFGETTGDFSKDDKSTTLFDSGVLTEKVEIIGFPKVKLATRNGAALVNWVVRLEDVGPDGRVALVTGGLFNANHHVSRSQPKALKIGEQVEMEFELRFTTWTFRPGHRVRISVANSIFPMILPSPLVGEHFLEVNSKKTWINLPVIPFQSRATPILSAPEPREERADAKTLNSSTVNSTFVDPITLLVTVITQVKSEIEVLGLKAQGRLPREKRRLSSDLEMRYSTLDTNPMQSSVAGRAVTVLTQGGREIRLTSALNATYEPGGLRLTFSREIFEDGKSLRQRRWTELVPWIPER